MTAMITGKSSCRAARLYAFWEYIRAIDCAEVASTIEQAVQCVSPMKRIN